MTTKRNPYTERDLTEARAWAKGECFVDADNYAHDVAEDEDNITKIAELIAKVRKREARRARALVDKEKQAAVDARELANILGAYNR